MRDEFASNVRRFADERVAPAELADIVGEACAARNGWKVILGRCAAAKMTRRTPMAFICEADRSAQELRAAACSPTYLGSTDSSSSTHPCR